MLLVKLLNTECRLWGAKSMMVYHHFPIIEFFYFNKKNYCLLIESITKPVDVLFLLPDKWLSPTGRGAFDSEGSNWGLR